VLLENITPTILDLYAVIIITDMDPVCHFKASWYVAGGLQLCIKINPNKLSAYKFGSLNRSGNERFVDYGVRYVLKVRQC